MTMKKSNATEQLEIMAEHLTGLIQELVHKPKDVKVEVSTSDDKHVFTITVASEEVGMVLGKHGKTIQSFRHIYRSIAAKSGLLIDIQVLQ